MTPMSFIVDPAVGQRARDRLGGQVDQVGSGCLPNLVMWIPRTQTSSCHAIALNLPGVRNRTRSLRCRSSSVPITSVASRTFMPRVTCSGSGSTLIRLARTLVPSQSTDGGHVGHRDPGAAKATMVKARTSPLVGDVGLGEVGWPAVGAGIAPAEEAGSARGALVGHQMRGLPQLQVVDQRNLLCHHPPNFGPEIVLPPP